MSAVEQDLGILPDSFAGTPRWFALQTKPRQEMRVIAHLRRRAPGVHSFLPQIEVVRHRARRRMSWLEPLFPSYLFLRMRLTPAVYDAVRWTPGARRVLNDGERPTAVPDDLIEIICQRLQPLGFIRMESPLRPGTRVRITSGPLEGLEGILKRPTSRRGRVRVLLEILGGCTPVEVDDFTLERF